MNRKKIGVLIGSVTQSFSLRACQAISTKAQEYGYDVHYFMTFNSHGDDNLLYGEGEQQIFTLPDYNDYIGFILALDTLNIPNGTEVLLERLRKISCPVVSLRVHVDGFYNVSVDERVSMEKIIRHFVYEHGFRDICFMTGRMELEDARLRFECYNRIMKEAGIEVTEDMIFYGDYWHLKAKAAVEHFLSARASSYPQAIICANDYMALAVSRELEERGVRVPEDVCVSGFDDLQEAQHAETPLTTVAVNFEEMAYRAVELIDEVNHGMTPDMEQYVSTQEKYRGSCGCNRHKVVNTWRNLAKELEDRKELNYQTMFMNTDLEGITDIKELFAMAYKYSGWSNAKKIWVCLCDASEELTEEERNLGDMRTEYTKTMVLCSVQKHNSGMEWKDVKFDRRELIPEEERSEFSTGSFFFIPLHYKNHNQGYVVVNFDREAHFNDFMQGWIMNFSVALESYYLHERLNAMNVIERMYKEDALTGIANRRGFEEKARKIYRDAAAIRKRVAVICIDMDNLKTVNDVHGHAAGDDALRRIGMALVRMAEQKDNIVYARTGGDEFAVVCRLEHQGEGEELVSRLREELQKVNEQYDQSYSAEVSVGLYEVKDASKVALAKALELSDERMYENKRQRKQQR